jgi:hypothetical protein
MTPKLIEIVQEFVSNMFEYARRCPDFCAACGDLESYVLSRTTWDSEGNEHENCPQDLYQTVSLPAGFNDLEEEETDLVVQYLGDVWPDAWRDAVAC